jgi:hypothetical protein
VAPTGPEWESKRASPAKSCISSKPRIWGMASALLISRPPRIRETIAGP